MCALRNKQIKERAQLSEDFRTKKSLNHLISRQTMQTQLTTFSKTNVIDR